MRAALLPCPRCMRHVKAGAPVCPFCDATLSMPFVPDHVPNTRGWKRAAVFSFGMAMVQCGGATVGSAADATSSDVLADTAGDMVVDTAGDRAAEAAIDALGDALTKDNGGIAPPYGITPKDAGVPADDGSFKADYGAPPPPDASTDR